MFSWFKERRRQRLLEMPFMKEWDGFVERNVAHYCALDADERAHLKALIQVFMAEKNWEGCGGLELTDEIRVTISAQACLLLLNLPHDYYSNVQSILVYPSTVVPPERKLGSFEHPTGPLEPPSPLLGQAFQQGPVILVWDAVSRRGRHPQRGHNVVYHEFAHKLDMIDGAANGTPPLRSREEYREWARVCSREYGRLRRLAESGNPTFLDAYGATSEAEFFAVATEQFFDEPVALKRQSSDLYRVLKEYYRQNPAERVARKLCVEERSVRDIIE
jgi:Mlc titration factor MtfA (ptsG expression regulator)